MMPESSVSNIPGERGASGYSLMSGSEAALRTLADAVVNVSVSSDTLNNGISLALPEIGNRIRLKSDPSRALAFAAGLAATGNPAGVFLESSRLSGLSDQLKAAAAGHLPLTIVMSEPLSTGAHLYASGAQSSISKIVETGCPVLIASSVQELADFIVLARLVSAEAMLPVIVFADGRDTAWSIQEVELPRIAEIKLPEDESSALTTYRSMLFGREAPGNLSWIDPTHPLGMGTRLPDELALKVRAGRHVFVKRELPRLLERAFSAFAGETGRSYSGATPVGPRDAGVVLLASGSVADELQKLVESLPSDCPPVGIIRISQLRPFPIESIAGLLRNKASAGVFVSTSSDNLDDLALVRDVRSALQAYPSAETVPSGRRRKKKAHHSDQPTHVTPVLYPAGWSPGGDEIQSLVRRLGTSRQTAEPLVLGARLSSSGIRAPEVERLGQKLAARSVDFSDFEVQPFVETASRESAGIYIIARSAPETWQLMEQTSSLLRAAGAGGIHAGLHPVSDATTRPVIGRIAWAAAAAPYVLVTRASLLGSLDVSRTFPRGANLIVGIPEPGGEQPSQKGNYPDWLSRKKPKILEVRLQDEIRDDLRIDDRSCLLAALVGEHPALKTASPGSVVKSGVFPVSEVDAYEELLEQLAGYSVSVSLSAESNDRAVPPEDETPADVAQLPPSEAPVANLDRFWKTTGHLFRTGRLQDIPADPFLTSCVLPARAGALTTHAGELELIPRVIQERCTGCGACWAVCPESALGAHLFTVESLFDSAVKSAAASGGTFVHVPRLKPAIVKTTHRLVNKDDLHQFTTAEHLLTEAFAEVLEKAGLDENREAQISTEKDLIIDQVAGLRPVRTAMYFDRAEDEDKGSGLLLSLTSDPDACTACGLCYAVCDEAALESCSVNREELDPAQEWKACSELRVPRISHESNGRNTPAEYLPGLLAGPTTSRVFRAGGADAGNLNRTVLKLFLESQHALSRPRLADLTDRLKKMIARIDGRLQEQVHTALKINDFAAFASSLEEMSGKLNPEKLTRLTTGSESGITDRRVDADPLAHLARLRGDLSDWLSRLVPAGTAPARPHMVLVLAMSERSFGLAGYPINPFAMPNITAQPEGVSELVGGLAEGVKAHYRTILEALSTADRIIEDVYDPAHDQPIDTQDLFDVTPAVLMVTDRFEMDTFRLLASGQPVKILIVSGGVSVVDSGCNSPDPVRLALSIEGVYVHQLPAEDPVGLLASLRNGLAHQGPALFHIYSPDSVRDGVDADQAMSLTRLAGTSRVFPQILRVPGSPAKIIADDGGDAGPGDWLLAQERFAEHFRYVRKREWSPSQVSVAEWLDLSVENRIGKDPFVERTRSDGRAQRFLADQFATWFVEHCHTSWEQWMSMAESPNDGARDPVAETGTSSEPAAPTQTVLTVDMDALRTLSNRLLEISGFTAGGESLEAWLADIQGGRET